jgi:hypothetical protein
MERIPKLGEIGIKMKNMAEAAIPRVILFILPILFAIAAAVPFVNAIARFEAKNNVPNPSDSIPNFWLT